MASEAEVRQALREVLDPEIGKPIEDIGMLQGIAVDGGHVRVDVLLTIEGCPLRDRITQDVTAAVAPLAGVEGVEVSLTPMSAEQRERLVGTLRGPTAQGPTKISFAPQTSIIAVASGKIMSLNPTGLPSAPSIRGTLKPQTSASSTPTL